MFLKFDMKIIIINNNKLNEMILQNGSTTKELTMAISDHLITDHLTLPQKSFI